MNKKNKLIRIINDLKEDEISDFYFHNNYCTGDLELNIELHDMESIKQFKISKNHKKIDSCAFWE